MKIKLSFQPLLATALVGCTLLTGCSEPEYPTPTPAEGPSTLNSRVLAVNAAPGSPAINLIFNNGAPVGTPLAYLNSFPGYVNAPAGPAQLRGKAASGSIGGTLGNSDILYRTSSTNQTNFNFAGGRNYSVFITDTLTRPKPTVPGGTNPGGLQFLVVSDNLAAPAAGKAHVRFLHLAPGAPAVWVNVVGGSTLFADRAYLATSTRSNITPSVNYTNFTPVDAGVYNLEVRTGSATGPVALTVAGLTLQDGKIYTIYARGIPNRTGEQALGASIIQHN